MKVPSEGVVNAAGSDELYLGFVWGTTRKILTGIAMDDFSGDGYAGEGGKSNVMDYFVETTGHYDGSSDIGINPWYDMKDEVFYDVE